MQLKLLFVCHGNICRSPMAEFVFRDLVEKNRLQDRFIIASAGTSAEELGNPVHPGTRKILETQGIQTAGKYAAQLAKSDYGNYDHLIAMDQWNVRNMQRLFGADPDQKIRLLLEFAGRAEDIADPWYTGDFDRTYADVLEGCEALLNYLQGQLCRS